jgi:hypothetical protein
LTEPFQPTGLAINKIAFRRTIPALAIVATARPTALPVAAAAARRMQRQARRSRHISREETQPRRGDFAAVIAK